MNMQLCDAVGPVAIMGANILIDEDLHMEMPAKESLWHAGRLHTG
jgi:hypothetical protein